jgi:hypothetical protein
MRFFFLLAATLTLAGPAAADAPDAQSALVERLGLLHIDARCALLTPGARGALEAGAAQARGALLRSGWTPARVTQLEGAVTRAAGERTCTDARTQAAVAEAREAYAHWARTSVMEFPGWSRGWTARRTTGINGWRLSQAINTQATFGVREIAGAQNLSLVVTETSATSARVIVRDTRRANAAALDLPTRIAYGLEAGAPAAGAATRTFPGVRREERRTRLGTQIVFTFPDAAFQAMLALDPRESVVIELIGARTTERVFVEVGDIAAARTFLTLRVD